MTSKQLAKALKEADDQQLIEELLARAWNVSVRRPKWWIQEQKKLAKEKRSAD